MVDLAELRLLAESGAVISATLEAVGLGVAIRAATRSGQVVLNCNRGHLRVFVDPRTAFSTLRSMGIVDARLKLTAWSPSQANM
jgi:hypothetical protein